MGVSSVPQTKEADRGASQGGLAPRQLAVAVLRAVLRDKQPLDDSFARLASGSAFASLEFRDRAFARAIATAAMRRLGQIDALIDHFLDKPLPASGFDAQLILVAGAAQLVFLDVPPHAAISQAVEQAKAAPHTTRFASLVNAILRRVAERGMELASQQDSALMNTPRWLFERWVQNYGADRARAIAKAHLSEPPLDISSADPQRLAERLGAAVLPWGSLRLNAKGRVEEIEGYAEGTWWVQDAAAALPALLLGDVRGLRLADLCAAPGGKTAQFVAHGADVTAVDISAGRIRRLKENLARLHMEASIVQADVSTWQPETLFDAVLLDAPCSATGTVRRNPDIPYLKSEKDIEALTAVQARLLKNASGLVKKGGRLVYCTCSLEREEGEGQIERFLQGNLDFVLEPIEAEALNLPREFIVNGWLRTLPAYLPDLGGLDGFFAARLRRLS